MGRGRLCKCGVVINGGYGSVRCAVSFGCRVRVRLDVEVGLCMTG